MEERLAPLCLLPPPLGTPWTGVDWKAPSPQIPRRNLPPRTVDTPLFWYAPDWYRVRPELASELAWAVTRLGVPVAALRSELGSPGSEIPLHDHPWPPDPESPNSRGSLAQTPPSPKAPSPKPAADKPAADEPPPNEPAPRIVPYRPDRYGLAATDFDGAAVIDVRLALGRDHYGRFAYSPQQIQRWEATPQDDPVAGGEWLPAATFPPDVPDIDRLAGKLNQLRSLAPGASIFVSFAPVRLDEELPRVIAAQPDGIILRTDLFHLEGLALGSLTRRGRKLLERHGAAEMPLWLVPGPIAPPDIVKLVELGASAVAIDSWCDPIRDAATQIRPPSDLAYHPPGSSYPDRVAAFVADQLRHPIGTVRGLTLSVRQTAAEERLGTFSGLWAKTLGVRPLG